MSQYSSKRGVTFIATGSELVSGAVCNTLSPKMAHFLAVRGFEIIEHRVVDDLQSHITQAIVQSAERSRAVIISGGLGPTSDDRTRFAVAKATLQPLVFCEKIWHALVQRMELLNLSIPDINKIQAMMPQGAAHFINMHGTAAGCHISHDETEIYMLPGPPNECWPMFLDSLYPHLSRQMNHTPRCVREWLLLGVSESDIAERCDPWAQANQVELAYCVQYPYLSLKVSASTPNELAVQADDLVPLLAGQWVVGSETASVQLRQWIEQHDKTWMLDDTATGGRLQTKLYTLQTQAHFVEEQPSYYWVVDGLASLWQGGSKSGTVTCALYGADKKELFSDSQLVPARGLRSFSFATEWVCWRVLLFLRQHQ